MLLKGEKLYGATSGQGKRIVEEISYGRDGVHIFRQLSPLVFDEVANEFVPTGAVLDVFDYSIDEQGNLELIN